MFKTLREKICSCALTICPRDLKFVPRPSTTEGFVEATKHNLPKSKCKQSQFVMAKLKTNQFRRNYFQMKINQQESATTRYTRFTGKMVCHRENSKRTTGSNIRKAQTR